MHALLRSEHFNLFPILLRLRPSRLWTCDDICTFMQMAVLVEDFLHSPGIDPQVEAHFRSFLAHQRVR